MTVNAEARGSGFLGIFSVGNDKVKLCPVYGNYLTSNGVTLISWDSWPFFSYTLIFLL